MVGANATTPSQLTFESIWRAPLVPVALAVTCGILLDRGFALPMTWTVAAATAAILACVASCRRERTWLTLTLIWTACASLAAAYHHSQGMFAADDIGHFAPPEPRPVVLRGLVVIEPLVIRRGGDDELRSFPAKDGGRFIVEAAALKLQTDWQPVSGRLQVYTTEPVVNVHVGDEVEITGRLATPTPPANPGEFDFASLLRDQRVLAVLFTEDSPHSMCVIQRGSDFSLKRVLASVRAWGQRTLTEYLPPQRQGLAIALLLGDGAPMTQDDWEKYIRTGVIHVLAVSGQHLVVLAAFLGLTLRFFRVRRRQAAILIAVFLLAYAMLVGGRAPVMRSVVAMCVLCGGLLVRRPFVQANSFALAWLVVLLLNPSDLFTIGCQLSFLSVAVLVWLVSGWHAVIDDPLEKLAAESRSIWEQALRWLGRRILLAYAVTLAIWIVVTPLVVEGQNVLAPIGLLIGPPCVVLTSVALLSGFALLLTAAVFPPLAHVAAWVTDWSLAGCDGLVSWSQSWPGASWYVPNPPAWWLWVFYAAVLGMLTLETLRRAWPWCSLGLLMLMAVGLTSGAARPRGDDLRCTFLAVGHGGCVVLEMPEGRVILYDVGSLRGPEVVRRHIAPFLWHRGIRRIDEVLLSHADLDHFNGLPALFERFTIGQVSCTPSFQERPTPAVWRTLKDLEKRSAKLRVLSSGQRMRSGGVEIEVLHPPGDGPVGNENSRSLVLLVHHAGNAILLTGDLEDTGLYVVTTVDPPRVDVLQAPHHGNRAATATMIEWCRPMAVVSCQGEGSGFRGQGSGTGGTPSLFATWPHGAVTIRSSADSLVLQTYVTKQNWRIK